ncbi:hypothetical protein [Budvicia aquatica]|uniref:Uncharacterized protein n=1 Tax=Budvicia aquatica TaxID=82979 RepID=A0A2C6DPL4_9GAMM|nr:hypothetical protein [Budvicia aquatica]PHI31157.1 hypothetical protein CRN84_18335 [Budvicia aquatica]VFS51410.1 Uncharacterised protein [Budvicia aquatica]
MTTYVQFNPSDAGPFRFTANINKQTFFITVPYNRYSNRYFVEFRDRNNNIAMYVPLIESPDDFDLNIALPFAPGSLVYRASTNNFEVN